MQQPGSAPSVRTWSLAAFSAAARASASEASFADNFVPVSNYVHMHL